MLVRLHESYCLRTVEHVCVFVQCARSAVQCARVILGYLLINEGSSIKRTLFMVIYETVRHNMSKGNSQASCTF